MAKWMPLGIRQIEPFKDLSKVIPLAKQEPLAREFLAKLLQGIEHSPGVYIAPKSLGASILPGRTYYMIDHTHEPYMPQNPGMHGAKLTAFFNNEETPEGDYPDYNSTPLFITDNGKDYFYFGTYSQTRWSDKLDADRMHDVVSNDVKAYHAAQLADPARPAWVTQALMRHFWPKPEYDEGHMFASGRPAHTTLSGDDDLDGGAEKKARKDFDLYSVALKAWERDARIKVGLLKKDIILDAFGEVNFF